MNTAKLGNSDLEITRMGLGTWAIGGDWARGWGHQDDNDSFRTIHKALDRGINWIDTAAIYGLGHGEEVVGKALKMTGHKPYVFTKCTRTWDEKGDTINNYRADNVIKEAEDSLRRLQIDVIDLYQIHWPPANDEEGRADEAYEAMARLQKQGKVRYLGVSNFSVSQLEQIRDIAPLTSMQPPYSAVRREAEREILPYCEKNGIGVIVYSPMGSGLLTGRMNRERIESMDEGDWRRTHELFTEPKLSANLRIASVMGEIAGEKGCTTAEVAITWTLCHSAVTAAIVGMRREEQVDGVIRGGEILLSVEDRERIARAF